MVFIGEAGVEAGTAAPGACSSHLWASRELGEGLCVRHQTSLFWWLHIVIPCQEQLHPASCLQAASLSMDLCEPVVI